MLAPIVPDAVLLDQDVVDAAAAQAIAHREAGLAAADDGDVVAPVNAHGNPFRGGEPPCSVRGEAPPRATTTAARRTRSRANTSASAVNRPIDGAVIARPRSR
jgi:hypothetical protein